MRKINLGQLNCNTADCKPVYVKARHHSSQPKGSLWLCRDTREYGVTWCYWCYCCFLSAALWRTRLRPLLQRSVAPSYRQETCPFFKKGKTCLTSSYLSCLVSCAALRSSWMFLVICSVLQMTSSVHGSVASSTPSSAGSAPSVAVKRLLVETECRGAVCFREPFLKSWVFPANTTFFYINWMLNEDYSHWLRNKTLVVFSLMKHQLDN